MSKAIITSVYKMIRERAVEIDTLVGQTTQRHALDCSALDRN